MGKQLVVAAGAAAAIAVYLKARHDKEKGTTRTQCETGVPPFFPPPFVKFNRMYTWTCSLDWKKIALQYALATSS